MTAPGARGCVYGEGNGSETCEGPGRVFVAGLAASPDKLSTKNVIHGGRWVL